MISENWAKKLNEFLEMIHIKSYVIFPIIAILLFIFFDLKKIKKWEHIPSNQQRYLIINIIVKVVIIISGIVQYFSN